MTQDTTTTSGAADLRATFSEMLVDLPNTEPYTLFKAGFDAALAAGQATAAQQGAYAALSESFLEIPDVQDESGINAYYSREVVLECIDAALASHGQAPAQPEYISREDWIEQAVRVYLIAGDTDEQAQECAAYLWGELDMDDLADPYDAAMSDIEGRDMPRKETQ